MLKHSWSSYMQCGCWNWPLGPLLMVSALKLNFSPIYTWLHELWPKLSWICGFGVTQWFRHRQATKLKVETEKIPQPLSLAYYPLVSLLSPRLFGHLSGHIRLLTLHLKAGDMRAVYCRPWNQISWDWIVAPPPTCWGTCNKAFHLVVLLIGHPWDGL